MWTYRQMLWIPWTDLVSKEEDHRRLDKAMKLEKTLKRCKLSYFGHVMRQIWNYLRLYLERKTEEEYFGWARNGTGKLKQRTSYTHCKRSVEIDGDMPRY